MHLLRRLRLGDEAGIGNLDKNGIFFSFSFFLFLLFLDAKDRTERGEKKFSYFSVCFAV